MKRYISILLAIAMLAIAAAPVAAARPAPGGLLTDIPVTGTLADGGSFVGDLTIESFDIVNGVLQVAGTLSGTATSATGVVTEIVDQVFEVAASLTGNGAGTRCDILFLDLGPLHLDLLGLNVDLSQIVLDVFAVPGPGNLLGNLLCAVAGLLDGGLGGLLDGLTALIDRINQLLG